MAGGALVAAPKRVWKKMSCSTPHLYLDHDWCHNDCEVTHFDITTRRRF